MNKLQHFSARMAPSAGFPFSRSNHDLPVTAPPIKRPSTATSAPPVIPPGTQVNLSFNVPFSSTLPGPEVDDILYASPGAKARWTHPEGTAEGMPPHKLPVHAQNVDNLRNFCKEVTETSDGRLYATVTARRVQAATRFAAGPVAGAGYQRVPVWRARDGQLDAVQDAQLDPHLNGMRPAEAQSITRVNFHRRGLRLSTSMPISSLTGLRIARHQERRAQPARPDRKDHQGRHLCADAEAARHRHGELQWQPRDGHGLAPPMRHLRRHGDNGAREDARADHDRPDCECWCPAAIAAVDSTSAPG